MNSDRVRRDFDAIARFGDRHDSGSDRYDAFLLASVPGGAARVLDIGCGLGRLTSKLARAGREIVAVDLSSEMIACARARLPASRSVEFICGDFLELELGASSFDCIVTSAALHHMPAEAALRKMRDLARPGGRLIVHDLRASTGVFDELGALIVLSYEAVLRLLRTGWPLSPGHVRRAWKRHGAEETYLTVAQARALAERCLPGSRLHSHRAWRYTVIWDKPLADHSMSL